MLKRIQKIQNIGRFVDCKTGGCEFSNETIIFGRNTYGKSTLTAILRSIKTGNNDLLIGRKTFGVIGSKKVEIDFDENGANNKYVFQGCVWNKVNENILIFDSKFIAENVFDGENITFDQQRNLNRIIIGKRGQELNKEIVDLQKKSEEYANQKRDKTLEFNRHFPEFDIEKFKSVKRDEAIDEKIMGKEREIRFEKEKEEIKRIIKSHLQSISSIKFSIKDTLTKTLALKQQEIEEHIKNHFSTEENARNFLKEGLNFLKNKPIDGSKRHCVFCGQELGVIAESLVDLYSAFFKGGYEELQNEINRAVEYFKSFNLESLLTKIASDLKTKEIDIGIDNSKIAELSELKNQFEKELEKKRDLNYAINFNAFDYLQDNIGQIKQKLDDVEKTKINITSPKTFQELEKEKKELEIIKKRYEPDWIKFCKDLETAETEAEKVRTTRDALRKELDTYSSAIFDTHKNTINEFCRVMNADFEIEDFKPLKKIVGTDERIFAIKFFGAYKVSIDGIDDKTPNFKNTLGDSDKRLLAFAFFLSLLSHDKELNNKIVVFDDPMSSFDSERLRKTVHLITDISCNYRATGTEKVLYPKQKIILTHQDRFAKELARLMPSARTLKIEEYTDSGQKRSTIVHADFNKDFPDDDISNRIEKIKSLLDNRQFVSPFEEDCRLVFEHIFKRKYYLDLRNEIAQKKSIRTFVQKLNQEKINGFDNDTKFRKFIRLCDDLNIELHDNNNTNSNGDKESILKDFFDCLKII